MPALPAESFCGKWQRIGKKICQRCCIYVQYYCMGDNVKELELLNKAKKGDELAMEGLFDRYKSLVTIISRKYFLQGGELADLIQEGMIGLYKAVHSYDSEKGIPFKSYAKTCIERNIINEVKKGSSLKNSPLNDTAVSLDCQGQMISDDDEVEFVLISQQETLENKILDDEKAKELVLDIKKQLSDYELSVLNLYTKGYSYVDIAKKLGKQTKSVDNALKRIKIKLSYLKEKREEK